MNVDNVKSGSLFEDTDFQYANDDDMIKKLYGLA